MGTPNIMDMPRKKPERTDSRKRVRRSQSGSNNSGPGTPTRNTGSGSSSTPNNGSRSRQPQRLPVSANQRRQQINAYYDLKKNSPALKAARINRTKRLNEAKWLAAQAQIPVQWRAIMVVFRVIIMSLVLFVMFRIMLAEKQILRLRNVLTLQAGAIHQSKMSWHAFYSAYEKKIGRSPPTTMKPWLDYAQEQQCEPFKFYNAIERDLYPFRYVPSIQHPLNEKEHLQHLQEQQNLAQQQQQQHQQSKITAPLLKWNELEDIATNYTKGAYLLVEISNNKLKVIKQDLVDWYAQHPTLSSTNGKGIRGWLEQYKLKYNLQWLFDPVIQHHPPITTRFVINLHTIPKSPINAIVPILSSHQESYHTSNDPNHPGNLSLEISNKNRNSIIDIRDHKTRDVLIPHLYVAGGRMGSTGMTSSPSIGGFWFWPFFQNGKPWQERLDTIVWRGSTLGNYPITTNENNNNNMINHNDPMGQNFFTGPRFELMNKWNFGSTNKNSGVHPISSNTPNINIDFAFTKLIIQNQKSMNQQQIKDVTNIMNQNYRFARRLSYRKLQQYKYIVDVDSNALSMRFSALLRSGSLIFKSTRYREWFSERLKSWKDYIPLDYDTNDLEKKLKWVDEQPPETIEYIIRHGKETVEKQIRPEDMQCYTYRMMLEYITLFDESSFTSVSGKRNLRSSSGSNTGSSLPQLL